jgi:hypothetical protein
MNWSAFENEMCLTIKNGVLILTTTSGGNETLFEPPRTLRLSNQATSDGSRSRHVTD